MAYSRPSKWSALLQLVHLCAILAALTGEVTSTAPVILVSIDGLGWQFTGGQFADTPNLEYIAKTGVKAEYMMTATPTKTWPNHQTYMTGLYPEGHGIVSNSFWDPLYKETFIFDYDCSNYDPKFWNESEPIWLSLQKQGRDTGMYFWPGFGSYEVKPTYYEKPLCYVNCSEIAPKDLPRYRNATRDSWPPYIHCFPNYSEPFQNRIDKIINWLKADKPPQFVGFYVDQPDWVGHAKGPESVEYKREIERVDRDAVGYLITQLRKNALLENVNLIFVSDHGFTSVNKSRVIFLDDFLDPSTYRLLQSGSIGHIWPNPGQLENIFTNLTNQLSKKHPQVKVYKRDEIPVEYHYTNNRRIPPIYVDPGFAWYLAESRAAAPNVSDDWVIGAHGYPASKAMASIFYARGPAFKKGYYANRGLRSVDVYPMMCDILGLEPRPNNGSLSNMADLLANRTPSGEGCVGYSLILMFISYLTITFFLVM